MLRRRPRHRHDPRTHLNDVRDAWIRRALAGESLDLVALDEVQAALVDSAASSGTVEVDDARLIAATDVLAAMALLELGEPQVSWVRARLVGDLGRHGEAAADNLHVVRRCDALRRDPTSPRHAEDLALWRDSALAMAATAYARAAQPLAAAVLAIDVVDADQRDDVALLLEAWGATGDSRVPLVRALLQRKVPDLDAVRHLQAGAARQALDGNAHATDAVLDALAALAYAEPEEPAHVWNRSALLFEAERSLEAAAEKVVAAARMEAAGEAPIEVDRARFHACLGYLLGDHPLAAAVIAAELGQPDHRAEAVKLLEDWLEA